MTYELQASQATARRIWDLCLECSGSVYDSKPPNDAYRLRTAQLLFGTAAQESGLIWERQRSMQFWTDRGAMSKWQLEAGSIIDSLRWLKEHPLAAGNATRFVFSDAHATPDWIFSIPLPAICFALKIDDNDRIGVLFARLHYFRDPRPIPDTIQGQAEYWKRVYNTMAGAGTVGDYMTSWRNMNAILNGTKK